MKEFMCPNCGAALTVKSDDDVVRCEYCDTVIDLERSYNDISAKKAQQIAEKVKEYKNRKDKKYNAKSNLEAKTKEYDEAVEKCKGITSNICMVYGLIWFFACLVFYFVSFAFFDSDGLRVFLDIVFVGLSGYGLFIHGKKERTKEITETAQNKEQAYIQLQSAESLFAEACNDFDENFLPPEVRNDEAIYFIINALETERAYTLKQAIGQWEDRSALQSQINKIAANNANNTQNQTKKDSDAEALGAFTGAAIGALGGAIAKSAIKEVIKKL